MKLQLTEIKTKIDIADYSLKEIAKYFEFFHGKELVVNSDFLLIKVKLDKFVLPHLLGLHYAYANVKNKRDYKGHKGFNKLISGSITYEELKINIKTNTQSKISWENVKKRIEYLSYFFNTISNKTRIKIINKRKGQE